MPIHGGTDINPETGTMQSFYQWGGHGKKYFYPDNDPAQKQAAYQRAVRQAAAAHAHGYKGE